MRVDIETGQWEQSKKFVHGNSRGSCRKPISIKSKAVHSRDSKKKAPNLPFNTAINRFSTNLIRNFSIDTPSSPLSVLIQNVLLFKKDEIIDYMKPTDSGPKNGWVTIVLPYSWETAVGGSILPFYSCISWLCSAMCVYFLPKSILPKIPTLHVRTSGAGFLLSLRSYPSSLLALLCYPFQYRCSEQSKLLRKQEELFGSALVLLSLRNIVLLLLQRFSALIQKVFDQWPQLYLLFLWLRFKPITWSPRFFIPRYQFDQCKLNRQFWSIEKFCELSHVSFNELTPLVTINETLGSHKCEPSFLPYPGFMQGLYSQNPLCLDSSMRLSSLFSTPYFGCELLA